MVMRIWAIVLLAIFPVHAMNLAMEVICQCAHQESAITQDDSGDGSGGCHSSTASSQVVKIEAVSKGSSCCPSRTDQGSQPSGVPAGNGGEHQDCCCGCEKFLGVGAVAAILLEKEACAFQDAYSTFEFVTEESTLLGKTESRIRSARAPPKRT